MFSSRSSLPEDRSKRLPIFVFPEELTFFLNDERNRKQILTLYNPYDVVLNFKILSNVPHQYRVVESHGIMKPHCCVDVVVRNLSLDKRDFDEKFRVDFFQSTKLIGSKQIPVKLVNQDSLQDDQTDSTHFKHIPSNNIQQQQQQPNSGTPSGILTAIIGIVSLLVLLSPLDNEWSEWIHVTVNMKMAAAFVLGLVTMVILRS